LGSTKGGWFLYYSSLKKRRSKTEATGWGLKKWSKKGQQRSPATQETEKEGEKGTTKRRPDISHVAPSSHRGMEGGGINSCTLSQVKEDPSGKVKIALVRKRKERDKGKNKLRKWSCGEIEGGVTGGGWFLLGGVDSCVKPPQ